jgi:DNA polymerase
MGKGPTPGEAARYLRQQGELGGAQLFLNDLTRGEVLELAFRGRRRAEAVDSLPAPDFTRPSPEGPLASDYDALKGEALACQRCALAQTRTNVVFSDGHPGASVMVVGEAPGAQEDKTGLAFVGPAGKLLDLLLASVGLSRTRNTYICNVLKCRPPGNRNPLPEEIQRCTPFLRRQIDLVSPEVILAVGTFSAQFLTGESIPLGRLRGEVYSYQGVPLVVTYHPAALLRNPGWTRATWEDLQLLRQVMDGG